MDRTVLINLARRPDRRAAFFAQPQLEDFPFSTLKLFPAIDGWATPLPVGWASGSGSRGCQQSHLAVLGEAIRDEVDNLLVLEDDAQLAPNFASGAAKFMAEVPPDWDCLMLGGQHRGERPEIVSPGIVRCLNCQRTHAYLIRGECMVMLYSLYDSMTSGHIDHIANRWQPNWRVYAPDPFLVGQAAGKSDINCKIEPTRFWSNINAAGRQFAGRTRHPHCRLSDTQAHAPKEANNPANLAAAR